MESLLDVVDGISAGTVISQEREFEEFFFDG
jgi:hypothetical protein